LIWRIHEFNRRYATWCFVHCGAGRERPAYRQPPVPGEAGSIAVQAANDPRELNVKDEKAARTTSSNDGNANRMILATCVSSEDGMGD
jgi:hypothetical protein